MTNNTTLLSTAMARVRDIFPNASVDVDNYGQIIIYTDTMFGDDATLIPFVPEDDA